MSGVFVWLGICTWTGLGVGFALADFIAVVIG